MLTVLGDRESFSIDPCRIGRSTQSGPRHRGVRHRFEVHRDNICVAALSELALEGAVDRDHVERAIRKYGA